MKVAVIQELPSENHPIKNKELGIEFCRDAVKLYKPDLILFPEMWSNGYSTCPFDLKDSSIWYKTAIENGDNYFSAFSDEARSLSTNIAITYLEKRNNCYYNSVSILDKEGKEILHYSKTQICDFGKERINLKDVDTNEVGSDYAISAGNTYDVCEVETKNGKVKVGAMICADREFPEVSTELFRNGAEIIVVPNSCTWDKIRDDQFRVRAFEILGGVVLANYPPPKNNGLSCAYDCIVWDNVENTKDNTVLTGSPDAGVYLAEFDLNKIRSFREEEGWRIDHKLSFTG